MTSIETSKSKTIFAEASHKRDGSQSHEYMFRIRVKKAAELFEEAMTKNGLEKFKLLRRVCGTIAAANYNYDNTTTQDAATLKQMKEIRIKARKELNTFLKASGRILSPNVGSTLMLEDFDKLLATRGDVGKKRNALLLELGFVPKIRFVDKVGVMGLLEPIRDHYDLPPEVTIDWDTPEGTTISAYDPQILNERAQQEAEQRVEAYSTNLMWVFSTLEGLLVPFEQILIKNQVNTYIHSLYTKLKMILPRWDGDTKQLFPLFTKTFRETYGFQDINPLLETVIKDIDPTTKKFIGKSYQQFATNIFELVRSIAIVEGARIGTADQLPVQDIRSVQSIVEDIVIKLERISDVAQEVLTKQEGFANWATNANRVLKIIKVVQNASAVYQDIPLIGWEALSKLFEELSRNLTRENVADERLSNVITRQIVILIRHQERLRGIHRGLEIASLKEA